MHVDVAIIGAGMAGIAAALEARATGRSVVLIDPSPGGMLRTVNGLEVGPQSLLGSADDVWWVLEQLSLSNDVVSLPRALPRVLVRGGRLCPISPSPVSLLTTKALTWGERFALLRELRMKPSTVGEESVHDFLTHRFGESFASNVAATALTGVFATPTDQLEAKSALPAWVEAASHGSVLRGLMKNKRVAGRPASYRLKHGFSSIGLEAMRTLPHVAQSVNRLRRSMHGWHVNEEVTARSVVVAVSPSALPALLGHAPSFEPVSIAVVHWRSSEARLPRAFGYLANPRDGLFSLGCIFTGALDPSKPDHFASFIGTGWHLDDALLRSGIDGDLRRLTGGSIGEIVHVERWASGFTPPRLGHSARVTELRAHERNGLFLAGAYLGSGTVRDAATFGRRAGRSAIEYAVNAREANAA